MGDSPKYRINPIGGTAQTRDRRARGSPFDFTQFHLRV